MESMKSASSPAIQNKLTIKRIFKLLPVNRESKLLITNLLSFCQNVHIYPVSHNKDLIQLKALKAFISKALKISLTSRTQITYTQFENLIRQISYKTFTDAIPQNDKIRMLLVHMKEHLKLVYNFRIDLNDSESEYKSVRVRKSRNGSSTALTDPCKNRDSSIGSEVDLDLNINAALKALQTSRDSISSTGSRVRTPSIMSRKQSRLSLKGNKAGRSFGAQSLNSFMQPKNRMLNSLKKSTKRANIRIDDISNKILNEKVELSEFIETERMLNREESLSQFVNRTKKRQLTTDTGGQSDIHSRRDLDSRMISRSNTGFNHSNHALNNGSGNNLLQKHRTFIIKQRQRSFKNNLVLKLVFTIWKSEARQG